MGANEKEELGKNDLSQHEVGRTAHSLMGEFEKALENDPEFGLALLNRYVSDNPHKKLEDPVKFKKGNYCYQVQYTNNGELEKLFVSKLPFDPNKEDWEDESIKLESLTSGKGHQFTSGTIRFSKYFKKSQLEEFRNTTTAVQKVREFLKANF